MKKSPYKRNRKKKKKKKRKRKRRRTANIYLGLIRTSCAFMSAEHLKS